MNKIVDTLIVAAMLMTSVPSLTDAPVLIMDAEHQEAPQDLPEAGPDTILKTD